jgi:hypothetical protein
MVYEANKQASKQTNEQTQWNRVLENLIVLQLVKKFPAFYRAYKSLPAVPVLYQIIPIYGLFLVLDFHFKINLPSTLWSSKRLFP